LTTVPLPPPPGLGCCRLARHFPESRVIPGLQRPGWPVEIPWPLVPDLLDPEVAQPRRFTYESVDNARSGTENHSVYNLEGSHRGSRKRIGSKTLHKWHGRMRASSSWPFGILDPLRQFQTEPQVRRLRARLGVTLGLDFYSLRTPVWRQTGLMIDHVDENHDPLMVLTHSHIGPIFDHQVDGVFCGARPGRLAKTVSRRGRFLGPHGPSSGRRARPPSSADAREN
jgi:hypothetical protein